MKLTKHFVADNKQIGWNEIENMISSSNEIRSTVEQLLKINPELDVVVTYNLEVAIM